MKKFQEDISNLKKGSKKIMISFVLIIIAIGVYIYINTYYVIVRFDELGPVSKNMSLYYNGFKVGKIVKIEPDDDYKHTLVRVNLIPKNLNLPQNATVQVKAFPSGELYLQLIYPSSPSLKMIKRGDVLEGISPYNLEEFMLGQNVSGVTDIVSIHVIRALDAMGVANMQMENFFKTTSIIMQDNRPDIDASIQNTASMTRSLAQAAENLNQATKKLNQSIDPQSLRESTTNIKDSTQNIKETTESINKATKNLDKTMKTVDETVLQVNSAAVNLNSISTGLNQTLSKRFGGMRVIFGKPIENCP